MWGGETGDSVSFLLVQHNARIGWGFMSCCVPAHHGLVCSAPCVCAPSPPPPVWGCLTGLPHQAVCGIEAMAGEGNDHKPLQPRGCKPRRLAQRLTRGRGWPRCRALAARSGSHSAFERMRRTCGMRRTRRPGTGCSRCRQRCLSARCMPGGCQRTRCTRCLHGRQQAACKTDRGRLYSSPSSNKAVVNEAGGEGSGWLAVHRRQARKLTMQGAEQLGRGGGGGILAPGGMVASRALGGGLGQGLLSPSRTGGSVLHSWRLRCASQCLRAPQPSSAEHAWEHAQAEVPVTSLYGVPVSIEYRMHTSPVGCSEGMGGGAGRGMKREGQ